MAASESPGENGAGVAQEESVKYVVSAVLSATEAIDLPSLPERLEALRDDLALVEPDRGVVEDALKLARALQPPEPLPEGAFTVDRTSVNYRAGYAAGVAFEVARAQAEKEGPGWGL